MFAAATARARHLAGRTLPALYAFAAAVIAPIPAAPSTPEQQPAPRRAPRRAPQRARSTPSVVRHTPAVVLDGATWDDAIKIMNELSMQGRDEDARAVWALMERKEADEERITALMGRGMSYRQAYAEVYDIDQDDLLWQEQASLIDADRRTGETRDDTVRRLYAEMVALQYEQAEQYCRGHMLNQAGIAAGISARSLFGGPAARAHRYASGDLVEWWETTPRVTLTEYRRRTLAKRGAAPRVQGRYILA